MQLAFRRTQPIQNGGVYVITCPETDRMLYQQLRAACPIVSLVELQARRFSRYAQYLLQDLFQSYYQPTLCINLALSPELHRHAALVGYLLESPTFRRVKNATQSDSHASLLAAVDFLEQMLARMAQQEAGSRRRGFPFGGGLISPGTKAPTETAQATLPLHYAALRAVEDVRQHLNAVEAMRSGWSILPGTLEKYPVNDIWQLLDTIRQLPDYAALLELVADLRQQMAGKGRQPRPALRPQHVKGVATGRTLEHLVPFELAKLADPTLEGLFHDSYENHSLTYYHLSGENPQAAEPLFLCLDTSASMNSQAARNLSRWVWAKALAFAMHTVTAMKHRPLYVMLFAAKGQMHTLHAPTGRLDAKDIVAMLTYHLGGGTYVETPLAECMTLMHNNSAHSADLLLVTDGETPLSGEFQSEFAHFQQKHALRLYTAFIDGRNEQLATLSRVSYLIAGTEAEAWLEAAADIGKRLM